MIIETKSMRLRPITLDDADQVFEHFDEEITTFMFPKKANSIDQTIAFIQSSLNLFVDKKEIIFVLEKLNTDEFLGLFGIHEIDSETPELGLWLKKDAHGEKLGVEAINAIIAYANSNLNYKYLIYPVDIRNLSSRNVVESVSGFPIKRYFKMSESNKELDIIEYHIYKEEKTDITYPLILFFGDSITDANRNRYSIYDLGQGYVYNLLERIHYCLLLNRGISGNEVGDLNKRLDEDVIKANPDYLSILIGINDIMHAKRDQKAFDFIDFKRTYEHMLLKVQKALPKTKILLMTPFIDIRIGSEKCVKEVLQVCHWLKELATRYDADYIDLQALFTQVIKNEEQPFISDGIHLTTLGHAYIAKEVSYKLRNYLLHFHLNQN
jgi:[ribosomal protein S5]-alanine N-acetyltransferase